MIYFDNHASTRVDPKALEAMMPFFSEHYGNAESSQHAFGWKAKSAVDQARGQVAALLNCEPQEIIFTSGATESIHQAILGFLEMHNGKGHIITSAAEHKATLEVCARAHKFGHELTVLPVNRFGQVELATLQAALQPNTILVSLMHANNEIGSVNPIAEIGAVLREKGITFHVDAAQTVGRMPIDVAEMKIDLLSLSSHKLYGPKGVGALFVRRAQPRVHIAPYFFGGGQERGQRGGSHNVPGIVGLGEACAIAQREMTAESERLTRFRDQVISTVLREFKTRVTLNGHPQQRLCNNINFTFHDVSGDQLVAGLRGLAYSSASACSAGAASHVLKAIGQNSEEMGSSVRFGLGRFNTEREIEFLLSRLQQTLRNGSEISVP